MAGCWPAPRDALPPQPGSLAAALIAWDAFNARAVTGREYHYAYYLSSPCRVQSGNYHEMFPAYADKKHRLSYRLLLFLSPACHGAFVKVAAAHHSGNRNVSDEWVFGYQSTAHSAMQSGMGRKKPSHPIPHLKLKSKV